MALNCVFIPLSMLTTVTLNNIETNQDMKYKRLTYGSGIRKTFLDESSFPSEDHLIDFKFSQAYTNWLTLIESVSEPPVSLGWHLHHRQMISDRGFVEWALAWHTHDRLLCSCFMQKPFILDMSSLAYKKQLECCLRCTHSDAHDYMQSGSHPTDASTSSV